MEAIGNASPLEAPAMGKRPNVSGDFQLFPKRANTKKRGQPKNTTEEKNKKIDS
jgi:hypothetical protein